MKIRTVTILAIAAITAITAGCGGKNAHKAAAPSTETAQTAQAAAEPGQPNTPPTYNGDGTFTDTRDGQTYRMVKIDELTWMGQNLNFKTGNSQCLYDGACEKYGRLYDWNTAAKACPAGWRLSTGDDWADLHDEAGDGDALKSKADWDGDGTDDVGFTALPAGGMRKDGKLDNEGCFAYWWTSEEEGAGMAVTRALNCNNDFLIGSKRDKEEKFYVRCVKEE